MLLWRGRFGGRCRCRSDGSWSRTPTNARAWPRALARRQCWSSFPTITTEPRLRPCAHSGLRLSVCPSSWTVRSSGCAAVRPSGRSMSYTHLRCGFMSGGCGGTVRWITLACFSSWKVLHCSIFGPAATRHAAHWKLHVPLLVWAIFCRPQFGAFRGRSGGIQAARGELGLRICFQYPHTLATLAPTLHLGSRTEYAWSGGGIGPCRRGRSA